METIRQALYKSIRFLVQRHHVSIKRSHPTQFQDRRQCYMTTTWMENGGHCLNFRGMRSSRPYFYREWRTRTCPVHHFNTMIHQSKKPDQINRLRRLRVLSNRNQQLKIRGWTVRYTVYATVSDW